MRKPQEKRGSIETVDKLKIRFARSNKFIKHVNAHNQKLFFALLVYLFFSAMIILLFMIIFQKNGCDCNFWKSCAIYFGIGKRDDMESFELIILAEAISRDLFSIYVVGISISNILVPQNPIELSEFGVFKNSELTIRYWIMLPVHQFLYDASIRVLITKKDRRGKESGKLVEDATAEDDEYVENLKLIRGVRRVVVPKEKAEKFMEKINKGSEGWIIYVIITGKLSDGKQYYSYKAYEKNTIHEDYEFVATDTKWIPEEISCQKPIGKLKDPDMIYMHFNLAFKREGKAISYFYANNNREQQKCTIGVEKGHKKALRNAEYGGINGFFNYVLNYFALFYLNNSSIWSTVLRKII